MRKTLLNSSQDHSPGDSWLHRVVDRCRGHVAAAIRYYSSAFPDRDGGLGGVEPDHDGDDLRCRAQSFLNLSRSRWARFLRFFIFPVLFLGLAHGAHAGFLDNTQANLKASSAGWLDNSLAIGGQLFATLLTCSIVISAVQTWIRNSGSLAGWGYELLAIAGGAAIPYVVFTTAAGLLPTLGPFSLGLGSQIAGVTVHSPSEIMTIFKTVLMAIIAQSNLVALSGHADAYSNPILNGIVNTSVFGLGKALSQMTMMLPALAAAGVIFLCGVVLAVELLFAYAQIYVLVDAFALMLGFLGAPGTFYLASQYLGVIVAAVVRFIIVLAMVAIVVNGSAAWLPEISSVHSISDAIPTWIDIVGQLAVMTLLTMSLSRMCSSFSSGQPVSSSSGVLGAAAGMAIGGGRRLLTKR